MKHNTRQVDFIEQEKEENNIPLFFLFYNGLVLVLLISFFLIMLLVVILPSRSDSTIMLQAIMIVQLVGIGYFLPFYFLPEIFGIIKFVRFRKINITLLSFTTVFFSLLYPLFKLFCMILN